MKKLVLLILIPIFCFSQNTKTDKVLNQVNTAAGVASGVIGLFKKNKNNDNTDNKTDTKGGKTSDQSLKNATPDGTFPLNAKPEDILAKVLKCTNKTLKTGYEEVGNFCVWKKDKTLFATKIDTVLNFNQNGIDNIVFTTITTETEYTDNNWGNPGFIRFQKTNEKEMKLVNNKDFEIAEDFITMYAPESLKLLKLDEDNIFYEIYYVDGVAFRGSTIMIKQFFDLNGKNLMEYEDYSNDGGGSYGNGGSKDTKMEIDKINKIIKLVSNEKEYVKRKLKVIKETKTYQYGNGTITEIKQPATVKPTVKTTKKK